MTNEAQYVICDGAPGVPDGALVIKDVGGVNNTSITNAAEEVIKRLISFGSLKAGQRLFYFDSEGDLDEILWVKGRFLGFKTGPR